MVQAVQRAVQVLKALAAAPQRLGVSDLADRLGVAKPTAHALLRTLEAEGLVSQDAESSKYQLGPGVVSLGNAYLDSHQLRSRSITWADLLANRTDSAVWVGVLVNDHVLVVHHRLRPGETLHHLETGASLPWNTCALGKAAVAFLPPADRELLLEGNLAKLTGAGVDDPAELDRQMREVRAVGHASDAQEAMLGEASIAAPVFDNTGAVAGAIGVVGAVERILAAEGRDGRIIAVREIARSLSRDLGAPRNAGMGAEAQPGR